MKKSIFLLMLVSLFTGRAKAQVLLKLYNDTLYNYEYAGGDEFNAPKLDETYWLNGLGWTRVLMSQDLSFNPNNVVQKDGLIRFIAKKQDSLYTLGVYEMDSALIKRKNLSLDSNRFLVNYSAGCIISKAKMHYGLYELRFKVEEGRGVWPAFWFYGGNENEEIDGFELKGEKRKQIHVDTHCPMGCDRGYTDKFSFSKNWGGWLPVKEPLDDAFNLMHLEWEAEQINWYFNGYPLAYFKGRFPNPMNLYLNTSVAKDGEAFKPGPDQNTRWPNTYSVDYIRIWKANKMNDTIQLKPGALDDTDTVYTNTPAKKKGLTYKKSEFSASKAFVYLCLDSLNTLTIKLSGKLNQGKSSIRLHGEKTDVTWSDFSKPNKIEIKPGEKLLRLEIMDGKKKYSKYLRLTF
ncbi:MAG: glycoside hydrolase family 16 protein [Bacteroidia bacterium]|nr:glycoside hydrolase family 16 protein [Bacteroidia bacterium]